MRSGTVANVGYSTLLFLHVLGAFTLVAAVGMFVAMLLAVRRQPDTLVARRMLPTALVLWAVGGLSALVFGIWLAIHVSQYSLTDGWILGAIVLWVIASAIGGRISAGYKNLGDGSLAQSQALVTHGLLVVSVLLLLLDMIYKPRYRMMVLAIRPDSWNFPLLLHVGGAMLLVASITVAIVAFVQSWREADPDSSARLFRFGALTMFFAALPAFIVMRGAAQWIVSKEPSRTRTSAGSASASERPTSAA